MSDIKKLKSQGKSKATATTTQLPTEVIEKLHGLSMVEAANLGIVKDFEGVKNITLVYPDGQRFTRICAVIDGHKVYLSKRLVEELADHADYPGDWTFRTGMSQPNEKDESFPWFNLGVPGGDIEETITDVDLDNLEVVDAPPVTAKKTGNGKGR